MLKKVKDMENKILAAIISLFLPGIGQYLLGKGNNWIILFVVILIIDIILAALLGGAGTYIAGLIGIIFALDAYCGWINI